MKMENLKKEIGATIKAYTGSCDMGGMFITETVYSGAIIKINKKSIRAQLNALLTTCAGKTTKEIIVNRPINRTATFSFWKTVNNKELYKNSEYGILEF
jgi:hypothetical protein